MSHLMRRVELAAKQRGIDMTIRPSGVDALRIADFSGVDVILLGPHVRYQQKAISEKASKTGARVVVIPEKDYATFNADKVLEQILHAVQTSS